MPARQPAARVAANLPPVALACPPPLPPHVWPARSPTPPPRTLAHTVAHIHTPLPFCPHPCSGGSAPSSRFSFQGPLAPVVMVSGGGGGGGSVPWRCAIDAFTGQEDVPQVAGWWRAGWMPVPLAAGLRWAGWLAGWFGGGAGPGAWGDAFQPVFRGSGCAFPACLLTACCLPVCVLCSGWPTACCTVATRSAAS